MERAIVNGDLYDINQYYDLLTQDIMDRVINLLWHSRNHDELYKILASIYYLLSLDTSVSVLVVNSWFNILENMDTSLAHTYPRDLTDIMIELGKEDIDMNVYIAFIKSMNRFPHKDLGEILEWRSSWNTK